MSEEQVEQPPQRGVLLPEIQTRNRSEEARKSARMINSPEEEKWIRQGKDYRRNDEGMDEMSKNIEAIRKRIDEQFPMGNYPKSKSQNTLSGLQKPPEQRKQYLQVFSKIKGSEGLNSPRSRSQLDHQLSSGSMRPRVQQAQYQTQQDIGRNKVIREKKVTKTKRYTNENNEEIEEKEEIDYRVVGSGNEGIPASDQQLGVQEDQRATPKKRPVKYYLPEGDQFIDQKLEEIRRRNRELQAEIDKRTRIIQSASPPHFSQGYSDLQLNSDPIFQKGKQLLPSVNLQEVVHTPAQMRPQPQGGGFMKPQQPPTPATTTMPPQAQNGMLKRIQAPPRGNMEGFMPDGGVIQKMQGHGQELANMINRETSQDQVPQVLSNLRGKSKELNQMIDRETRKYQPTEQPNSSGQQIPEVLQKLQGRRLTELINRQTQQHLQQQQQQQPPQLIHRLQSHSKDLADVINRSTARSPEALKSSQGRGGIELTQPQQQLPDVLQRMQGKQLQKLIDSETAKYKEQLPPVLQQIQGKKLVDMIGKETQNMNSQSSSMRRRKKKGLELYDKRSLENSQDQFEEQQNGRTQQQTASVSPDARKILDQRIMGLVQNRPTSAQKVPEAQKGSIQGPILRRPEGSKGKPLQLTEQQQLRRVFDYNNKGSIIDAINIPSGIVHPSEANPTGAPVIRQTAQQRQNVHMSNFSPAPGSPNMTSQAPIRGPGIPMPPAMHYNPSPDPLARPEGGSRMIRSQPPQSQQLSLSNVGMPPSLTIPGAMIVKSITPTGPPVRVGSAVMGSVPGMGMNSTVVGAVPPSNMAHSVPSEFSKTHSGGLQMLIAHPDGGNRVIRTSQLGSPVPSQTSYPPDYVPETQRRLALGMANYFQNSQNGLAPGQLPVVQVSSLYPQQINPPPPAQKKKHWYNKCCTIF